MATRQLIKILFFFFSLTSLNPEKSVEKKWLRNASLPISKMQEEESKTNLPAKNFVQGKEIFLSSCNACHLGGNNLILPEKNLRKESLDANGMNTVEAIVYQVTNGKNGMPAFGGRLTRTEIENVAFYVLQQSEDFSFEKN